MSVISRQLPHFHLRTILLLVNLLVLVVPLGSIYLFSLYENELVRQTESELIVQGAFIATLYKQTLQPLLHNQANYGMPVERQETPRDEKYTAIEPVLDLSHAVILPTRPDAQHASHTPDPIAQKTSDTIFPVLQDATLTTLAGIRIVDFNATVVAGREEQGLSLANVQEVETALKGQYAAVLRERVSKHDSPPLESLSRGGHIRVFVAMPIIQNNRVLGAVYLSRSPRSLVKGLFDNLQTFAVAGCIILAITLLLALLTSYAISRPIYALIEQTQRIARGEKSVHSIKNPVTHELALLSDNITKMALTISERSDYIRNFAMHVSHEFKTPLTAIQGAIELIQEHGDTMSPEQLNKFLNNTTKDTERLRKLVTRLLEMARADVMQPVEETCDIVAVIQGLQQSYLDKNITVALNVSEKIIAPLPFDILQTVLNNLFENSCQHGATKITIHTYKVGYDLRLTISDNGEGISPSNSEKLFTPFFTTKREKNGTGLGLAIIRSLLSAYGAEISFFPQKIGASFEILF